MQSVPGSDRYRCDPTKAAMTNLALAGDWTDCGMNAGCIEAAVMSGLEAANGALGQGPVSPDSWVLVALIGRRPHLLTTTHAGRL